MRKIIHVALVVAFVGSPLYAQGTADSLATAHMPGAKSEMAALNLSLGCTVIPYLVGYKIADDNEQSDIGPAIIFSSIALGSQCRASVCATVG